MSHHDIPNSRYSVFLPLFDLLFVSKGREETKCLPNLQETRPVRIVNADVCRDGDEVFVKK
jgi:hypothetical protein